MNDRPDLLLGIIVTHVVKQQQQQQPMESKATAKPRMYDERQQRTITESVVNDRTMPTTSAPSTVIRETETIASPVNKVTISDF